MKAYGEWMFFFIAFRLVESGPPNLHLLQNENKAYCVISNESENNPIVFTEDGQPVIDSHALQDPHDIFSCKISTERKCEEKFSSSIWKYDASNSYDLAAVTDRRWEDLKLMASKNIEYIHVHNIANEDFNFELSVKIRADAYVYLCDGVYPPESNCYWFIIGGWNGKQSVVRNCTRGTIPKMDGDYRPKGSSCSKKPNITHGKPPVDKDKWTKLKFHKTNNKYIVSQTESNKEIISYYVPDTEKFEKKYVIIASLLDSPGEWKINDSEIIYRTGENKPKPLSTEKSIIKGNETYSFSILHRDEKSAAYFYLCENTTNNLPCYKITFQNKKKPTVCITETNFITCDKKIDTYKQEDTNFVTWSHITLKIDNIKYEMQDNYRRTLLQFHDDKFKPKDIFIASDSLTYWKFHSYGLLTADESGDTSIDLNEGKKDQRICIAVYAHSCNNCTLNLKLMDDQNRVLANETQTNKNAWEEIKLTTVSEGDIALKLNITLNTSENGPAFIGDIRDCSKNYRIISTTFKDPQKISCNSLEFPSLKATKDLKKALIIRSDDQNIIDIIWTNPKDDSYNLKSRFIHKGCSDTTKISEKIHNKEIFLKDSLSRTQLNLNTIAYTKQQIQLLDKNNKTVFSEDFDNAVNDSISDEEFPKMTYSQEEDKLIVNLTIDDCKKLQGPLFCDISLGYNKECINDCSNKQINGCTDSYAIPIECKSGTKTIPDVCGLSNYTLFLGISRSENGNRTNKQEKLSTTPTAPPRVPNVTIYSVTNNSFSLRWKEPYPKTGELEMYVVEYIRTPNLTQIWETHTVTTPEKCILWPEFICSSVQGLQENRRYLIKVKAKNKEIEKLSKAYGFDVELVEKAPHPPENITISWDDRLNLTITCNYPFQSDGIIPTGPIRKLIITINNQEFSFNITEESKVYTNQIDASNFSASFVTIKAKYSNLAGNSTEITITTNSPPKTPKIQGNLTSKMGNEVYINVSAIENLDGKSELFIFQGNRSIEPSINLTKNCSDDLQTLNNSFSGITNETITNSSKTINITVSSDFTNISYIVIFIRNNHNITDKCTVYSEIPIRGRKTPLEINSTSSTTTWVLVVLFLLCLCTGTIFYMYKKEKLTYKPKWLSDISPRGADDVVSLPPDNFEGPQFSYSVEIGKFGTYVTRAIKKLELKKQYDLVDNLETKEHTVGSNLENLKKNRYKNIIAYDDTRVVLNSIYSNGNDDYINANYIKGFDKEKTYIATQAPTPRTLNDFWRMIWQQNIECIVMLSRLFEIGKRKSEQYWPELHETSEYDGKEVTCTNISNNEEITIRTLMVSCNSTKRQLTQIHYEGWPDKDVPSSTKGLRDILLLMLNFQNAGKPIVVHCSAGVGRTGTLILCDVALQMAKATQTVDMFSILHDLRQQRSKMVQTYEQYEFAHQVVVDSTTPIYNNVS